MESELASPFSELLSARLCVPVEALDRIRALGPSALPSLLAIIQDRSLHQSCTTGVAAATELLIEMQAPETIEPLLDLLHVVAGTELECSLDELGTFGAAIVKPAFSRLATATSPDERAMLVYAIAASGVRKKRIRELVVQLFLENPDHGLRCFRAYGDSTLLPLLERDALTYDPHSGDQRLPLDAFLELYDLYEEWGGESSVERRAQVEAWDNGQRAFVGGMAKLLASDREDIAVNADDFAALAGGRLFHVIDKEEIIVSHPEDYIRVLDVFFYLESHEQMKAAIGPMLRAVQVAAAAGNGEIVASLERAILGHAPQVLPEIKEALAETTDAQRRAPLERMVDFIEHPRIDDAVLKGIEAGFEAIIEEAHKTGLAFDDQIYVHLDARCHPGCDLVQSVLVTQGVAIEDAKATVRLHAFRALQGEPTFRIAALMDDATIRSAFGSELDEGGRLATLRALPPKGYMRVVAIEGVCAAVTLLAVPERFRTLLQ